MLYKVSSLFKKRLCLTSLGVNRGFLTTSFDELNLIPKSINSYEKLYNYSVTENEQFWSCIAKNRLEWFKVFDKTTSGKFGDENFHLKWFINGKLNVSGRVEFQQFEKNCLIEVFSDYHVQKIVFDDLVNCVDRHFRKAPNKIALIWEKDKPGTEECVTYEQLYKLMNQFANLMKSFGVAKGDRVAIYMPASPMAIVAMLACARIGAIHSIVFAGFSSEALSSRINDAECSVLITTNQMVRGGKTINLKKTVDSALETCPSVKHVFVSNHTHAELKLGKRDLSLEKELSKYPSECQPEVMDSEDPLFMLYTSGSTGKPKGLVHTQAGYLTYVSLSHQLVFDYKQNDIFGCVADIGWITGHSYVVYGPLSNGGTTVLFESTPNYPNPGRYWETIERLKINQFYASPTALRFLMRYDNEWVKKYDRSSLKTLGSVGEPINPEAWHWYNKVVGDEQCRVVDTWWQTETGGICITPLPCDNGDIIKPAIAMRPFLGINPVLLDEKGNELSKKSAQGFLCIKHPWPGMARTIYGDHNRYLETYLKPFAGYYYSGDGANVDGDGHFQITGRVDDVINVSGHRIGTAEIEEVLGKHESIAESACVGVPHDLTGEAIYAFVSFKENIQINEHETITELKQLIKQNIAAYAIPDVFLASPHLPKTRSGKIMRRILRKIATNKHDEKDLGDISTLADPSVVTDLIERHQRHKKKHFKV